jgi:hypothetical protein
MRAALSFIVFLAFFLASCQKDSNTAPVILAEVGTQKLTKEIAKKDIPSQIFESDSATAYRNYRDEWIRRQVILQEAERLNFTERRGVQEKLERIREEYILQAVQDYVISEFEEDSEVTEQEARNYYQQNKDKFTLDERYVRYRHLIASSNAQAEQAKRDLMRGIDWETVAKEYSKYADLKIRESERYWPISIAGGDIAMLNRYLTIIGPSEISPTHRTGNEYHFVQLTDERPEGDHPDLDWLIDQIQEWLTLEKRKRAFNTYIKNLYLQGQANNEITIYNVTNETNTAVSDTVSLNTITNEE